MVVVESVIMTLKEQESITKAPTVTDAMTQNTNVVELKLNIHSELA